MLRQSPTYAALRRARATTSRASSKTVWTGRSWSASSSNTGSSTVKGGRPLSLRPASAIRCTSATSSRKPVSGPRTSTATLKDERDATLAQLARGEITVVANCMVLTEGWDCPDVGCIVLARPTKSMGLFRQMIGRVLRPAPWKPDAIVIDHAGCVYRHGFAEDHVEWRLEPDKPAGANKTAAAYEGEIGSRIIECSNCSALRTAGEACSHCGFKPEPCPHYVVCRPSPYLNQCWTMSPTSFGLSIRSSSWLLT